MEKKTKHRMLGILVVVGLVLLSLPLLQSGKESNDNASLVKAPPFPDQPIQVSTVTEEKVGPVQPSPIPLNDPSHPVDIDNGGVNQQPDDTIKVNPKSPTMNPTTPGLSVPSKPETGAENNKRNSDPNPLLPEDKNAGTAAQMTDKVMSPNSDSGASPEGTDYLFKNSTQSEELDETPPAEEKVKHTIKSRHIVKMHSAALKQPAVDNDANGLFKLKGAVWVVQVGSFKNKENALRLVNKLRLNGFRAFIQQAATYTQVFVGPENKPYSARALKNKLEAELHMNGIVISYKPLKL